MPFAAATIPLGYLLAATFLPRQHFCAPSTKKLCAIWEVSELTFAGIERIIASWRREETRQVSDRQEGEEETGWRRKSFVHLQYFWTWMAP